MNQFNAPAYNPLIADHAPIKIPKYDPKLAS